MSVANEVSVLVFDADAPVRVVGLLAAVVVQGFHGPVGILSTLEKEEALVRGQKAPSREEEQTRQKRESEKANNLEGYA